MYKVFKYRLYPTASQRKRLEETLETCRQTYNSWLGERKAVYETEGRSVKKLEQLRSIKVRRKNNEYAAKVYNHTLQVVCEDLDKAFQAFFRRMKSGKTPGYPRSKSKGRFRSFGLKQLNNGFGISGRRLRVSTIGRIAIRWHRPIEGKIKTLRLVLKAGKWYAFFACEVEPKPLPKLNTEVGIDAGLTSLMTLSSGEKIENPRWYRNSQAKQRVLQRRVSRRKLGGSNRRKAVKQLAKHSEHTANQRKDFLNKLVFMLVATFGRIAIEDLSITNMVRNHCLSKSILDAGWGYFKQRLVAKAENAGRTIALVPAAYTTQTCCVCGKRQKLTLKQRWYTCPCGNSLCRDVNAARTVLGAGRSLWALSSSMEGLAREAAEH